MVDSDLSVGRPSRGRWERWAVSLVVAGLVVIAINATMAYLALHSSTGLVTENYYEKGLAYNEVLVAQRAQDALGWRGALVTGAPKVGVVGQLAFTLVGREGVPIRGAAVEVALFRPVAAGHDRRLVLAEVAPGRYEAPATFDLPGMWEVKVRAVVGQAVYRYAERISVGAV
ncbi:MAG: FixH family protein [Magnetococcales bacterium]|nr:FixH family protein [Magnetococcales bacterium]